jgi:hypothetical protein
VIGIKRKLLGENSNRWYLITVKKWCDLFGSESINKWLHESQKETEIIAPKISLFV